MARKVSKITAVRGKASAGSIDGYIAGFPRDVQKILGEVRSTIRKAAPGAVEDIRYGIPTFVLGESLVHFAAFKNHIGFYPTPDGIKAFKAELSSYKQAKGSVQFPLDKSMPLELIRRIVRFRVENVASTAGKKKTTKKSAKKSATEVKLLSGGNPQIAKADGDGPVQAYIAAMPGWKGDVGRQLDALIERTVPEVRKAVRWNTPFYGVEGRGWFLGYHCITKYVKVSFFRGTSLRPVPPVASKQKEVRYFHIFENDEIDEGLVGGWIRQAATLPGEGCF